jgi:hypothetical protein
MDIDRQRDRGSTAPPESMRFHSTMTLLHTMSDVGAAPASGRDTILAYLREVRHDRGYSLDDAAAHVGVSPINLAGALWGQNDLPAQAVERLADLFAVDHALVAPLATQLPRLALIDDAWQGDADADGVQPGNGWPQVVAKEGSD